MNEPNYTLYTGNHCASCVKVATYLEKNDITFDEVNIDTDDYELPFTLMVIPALIENNELLAYGPDIIEYFLKKRNV